MGRVLRFPVVQAVELLQTRAETDGDPHIALSDATGDKMGTVVCEVPLKPQWCDIRETVSVGRQRDFRFTLALTEN